MATTKALIKALTDVVLDNSVQFPKQQVSVSVTTSGQSIIAPADGYCQGIVNEGTTTNLELDNVTKGISSSANCSGGWARCHTPVKKGDKVNVWFLGTLMGVYWMKNTIRGGAKLLYKQCSSFFERGALWPRLSLCSTPQSRLGACSPTPTLRGKSISRRYTTTGPIGTHHRTTGGSWALFGGLRISFFPNLRERALACGHKRMAQPGQFRSERDIQSRFISPVGAQKRNFISSPHTAGSDFAFFGGVA